MIPISHSRQTPLIEQPCERRECGPSENTVISGGIPAVRRHPVFEGQRRGKGSVFRSVRRGNRLRFDHSIAEAPHRCRSQLGYVSKSEERRALDDRRPGHEERVVVQGPHPSNRVLDRHVIDPALDDHGASRRWLVGCEKG